MEGPGLVAAARLEEGIPKLLVKVSPTTAANSAKNLGEVTLRKLGSAGRSHVAVVHLSAAVPTGIVLISTKLAELLGVSNGEQVQIARSERRRGSREEENEGAARSQSKQAGSLPPDSRRVSMAWSESPLFAQGRNEHGQRRTVGGRTLGTPQAKVAEELPEHLTTPPRGYMPPRMASVASSQGFHHPPMPVAQAASRVGPKSPMQSPSTPIISPYGHGPYVSHARSMPNPCNSPAVAMRMTRVSAPTNFAFHMSRPKVASPKVLSARNRSSVGGYSRMPEAETADWLPSSFGTTSTWQATQRQVPPSSPPALIPKSQPAESRSPSPPTPSPSPQEAKTRDAFQNQSPKFYPVPAPAVDRSDDKQRSSPSPPLQPRRLDGKSPSLVFAPPPAVGRVERRVSLPAELLRSEDWVAAMAPVPSEKPSAPVTSAYGGQAAVQSPKLPVYPPPLVVAPMMVAPPPPKTTQGVTTVVDNKDSISSIPVDQSLCEEREEVKPPMASPTERRASKMALVPIGHDGRDSRGLRSKQVTLGALQCETNGISPEAAPEALNDTWLPPNNSAGGQLERSELGTEITSEVRRWLTGHTSGLQCSHVVMDKALTVLSNFKLSSGCELEVLGGPLGAIIGGYNEEDWLYQEIFSKAPGQALQEAFQLLGFPSDTGDWSNYMVEEISLAYRRQCLRGHPSRGGSARNYLKLQVALELVRAFEAKDLGSPEAESSETTEAAWSSPRRRRKVHGFVLDDLALVRELELSPTEAAMEADNLPAERLEELNRALDEYILRQMCFKSEIVAEIARLHENSAYSILGVSPEASDSEIKKAYRLVAMQCHPDKGGNKAEFQELHEAYEKIMEQRRSSANLIAKSGGPTESPAETPAPPKAKEEEKVDEAEEEEEEEEEGEESAHEDEDGGEAQLLAKSGKAAEEASRYAKTAADFAHQAAEAAETARQGRSSNALALTKSIAHSAIVLTLTVVKAVRVVGYATMDVAAQCRLAARKFQDSAECAECSTEAMGLGLEALNAALSCAEVTEVTAAELSRDVEEENGSNSEELASERFVGAAVRASLAAASASNAAMSAAIAAVEGNRQCIQAAQPAEEIKDPKPPEAEEEQSQKSEDSPRSEASVGRKVSEHPEDQGLKRQINQRNNNHKVLLRLNAEILLHQQNVRQFLQANRQLIPEVSCEARSKVQTLLHDYAQEVQAELQNLDADKLVEELPTTLKHSGLLAPLLQSQVLAIPVCPKARVLKMAALYDLQMTFKVLEQEIFEPARQMLLKVKSSTQCLDELIERIQKELRSYTDGG